MFLILNQTAAELETAWESPRFFAAIFAGLVIAIALQLLLTNLSVALGVTAASGLNERDRGSSGGGDSSDGIGKTIRKFNHAYGIWALISGSIALFFGAWLGVELSMTVDQTAGAVLGLVIWGLFYFSMMFVEASVVSGVIRTAASGLASATSGIGNMLGKSDSSRAVKLAGDVTATVRDELLEDRRIRDLGRNIRRTLDELEAQSDPARLRDELETLVGRTEFEAYTDESEDGTAVTASLKTRPGPSKTSVKKMASAASAASSAISDAKSVITEEAESEDEAVDSATHAAMRLTGVSKEEAREYREKFEDYLRKTDSEALDPEGLKADLKRLFDDPGKGWAALKERFSNVNRDTVKGLLTARGIDDERAERVTSWAEAALQKMQRNRGSEGSIRPGARASGGDRSAGESRGIKERANARIAGYLREVDDPRLRYEDLRDEFELLLDDPRAGSDVLAARLRSLDRETLKSLIAARPGRDEEEAENVLRAMENARDRVIERAEKVRDEVQRRAEAARQASLEAAEEARKTVSVAAWWAFASAAVSAAAAAIAGIIAVGTGIGG